MQKNVKILNMQKTMQNEHEGNKKYASPGTWKRNEDCKKHYDSFFHFEGVQKYAKNEYTQNKAKEEKGSTRIMLKSGF